MGLRSTKVIGDNDGTFVSWIIIVVSVVGVPVGVFVGEVLETTGASVVGIPVGIWIGLNVPVVEIESEEYSCVR